MAEAGYDMNAERGKRKKLTEKELKKLKKEERIRIYGITAEDKLDRIIDRLAPIERIIRGY